LKGRARILRSMPFITKPTMQTHSSTSSGSWLARQPLNKQLFLACTLVTALIMALIGAFMAWQGQQVAIANVRAANLDSLEAFNRPLQLTYNMAMERNQSLYPVLLRYIGGTPEPMDTHAIEQDAGVAPELNLRGMIVNGRNDLMASVTGLQAEILARSGRNWYRIASALHPQDLGKLPEHYPILAELSRGEPAASIENEAGKWFATYAHPLRDESGLLYGGILTRIDVTAQVAPLLEEIKTFKLATYGTISIVKATSGGQDWTRIGGAWGTPGRLLSQDNPPQDFEVFKSAFQQSQGVERLTIEGKSIFLAWRTIENWDWVVYGFGTADDFLAQNREQTWIQLGMMLTGTLIIALLVGVTAARTLRPVRHVVEGMGQLGQGVLNSPMPGFPQNSRNEVHILLDSLHKSKAALRQAFGQVRDSVGEIHVGINEIAAGNTDLSSRTEQQAASLQETASSMEQLASTVRQNADHARQASSLAEEASAIAQQGGSAVSNVVHTMERISTSSGRIGEIVNVIDGIAFQTNILALNAAVEAARAGEQGKGFAVVANEVRSLAQRSAEAAREIKDLIENSSAEVSSGSRQVAEAGSTMNQLLDAVESVTVLMKEIASASQEQSSGIDQVNIAVTQMDSGTQQNAALVEEAATAAQSLQNEAHRLAQIVHRFKTDESDTGPHLLN